jgi:16S rRNA (cytosine1402-N4)-methyltransferase
MGTHPARRVFQALRICVNDELKELERGLAAAEQLSSPEAVVIAVSYHSLEDRIVKHRFRAWEKEERKGIALTKHPVLPDDEEVEKNFKARSAKLRVFCFRLLEKTSGGKAEKFGTGSRRQKP